MLKPKCDQSNSGPSLIHRKGDQQGTRTFIQYKLRNRRKYRCSGRFSSRAILFLSE